VPGGDDETPLRSATRTVGAPGAGSDAERNGTAEAEAVLERLFRLAGGRKMYARQSAAVGVLVTRAGYAILRSLSEAGPISTGELARLCTMDAGAAVRQVKALEDDGLVTRTTHDDDARVTVVALTDEGAAVYRRIVEVRTGHMDEVLSSWSAADRAELTRLVGRLVDDLRNVPFRPRLKEPT
jgi:DNA-binding MarR family transcriptional regulator